MWHCWPKKFLARIQYGSLSSFTTSTSSSDAAEVLLRTEANVRVITLNRPHSRNAVNKATANKLYHAFKEFDSDSSAHVAVLHGAGDTFCAGYDLKELAAAEKENITLSEIIGEGPAPMGPTHMEFSKPVIAAVSGHAVAGGLELALMCDLRVVEEGAVMGVYCRRFGVPLLDGGTARLPPLIGLSRALDMILTGRPVNAKEALDFGLANRLVPKGQALEAAISLAKEISQFPQQCLRADRWSALHGSRRRSLQEALGEEMKRGSQVVRKESIPGARAFAEGKGRHGQF